MVEGEDDEGSCAWCRFTLESSRFDGAHAWLPGVAAARRAGAAAERRDDRVGSGTETSKQTCTAANCGATVLIGRVNRSQRSNFAASMPWVAQLHANPNECLRLHVTSQGAANTELVTVAPGTGRAWRNDSSNVSPCPTCPLLKIRTTTNENGWFLVQVNQTAGASVDAEFVLRYARYAATNPNCAAPTVPLAN